MKYSKTFLFVKLVAIPAAIFVSAVVWGNAEAKQGGSGTPTFLNFSGVRPTQNSKNQASQLSQYNQDRLLAGHLLRRAGFGPAPKDLKKLTKKGAAGRLNWIQAQLNPDSINDDKAEAKLPDIRPNYYDYDYIRRWYTRMALSKRQLQEKITLIWHEHFSVSDEKVGWPELMGIHEDLLRYYSLRNFRDLLVAVTTDSAMLYWLDNDYNNGNDSSPPNENYAREFLQLFVTGTVLLNIDGTPVLDGDGNPLPAYTETDVREIARAMTGWHIDYDGYPDTTGPSIFDSALHDSNAKNILGAPVPAGLQSTEVAYVVDLVLAQRTDTIAAFIAKTLILKLATETPTSGYVQRVAEQFRDSGWSIREAVQATLTDPEFESAEVVRTQFKEPIEQFIGAVRGLSAKTDGGDLPAWTYQAGQLIYYPPSVFSFYRPGDKGALVSAARVFFRDKMADEFTSGWYDTYFIPAKLQKKGKFNTPAEAIDYLCDVLLAAPLQTELRTEFIDYMEGQLTDEKIRGAVWLIMTSPDFQRN